MGNPAGPEKSGIALHLPNAVISQDAMSSVIKRAKRHARINEHALKQPCTGTFVDIGQTSLNMYSIFSMHMEFFCFVLDWY